MNVFKSVFFTISLLSGFVVFAQDISLFRQFSGNYDYLAFGNTLNLMENGTGTPCEILTESSAEFSLEPHQEVIAAYLYWAGSGPGEWEVKFNQIPVVAERRFNHTYSSGGNDYVFFSAFADITQFLISTGNGTFTLSDLDLSETIPPYCYPAGTGTNFGGWAVMVIYEDPDLPMNQIHLFDGLESVSRTNQTLEINLENLMIVETENAKIGFLAWEGDRALAVNETLQINNNILSNPPLNPPDNAFNGTNSFTGSDTLYNMDIDFYSISDYIRTGDRSANIKLTSGQDFVMINNIITVMNSELPDATISIDLLTGGTECENREITLEYTVYNHNSTAPLPAQTPIAVYANDILTAQTETRSEIPVNGQESGIIEFEIPSEAGNPVTIKIAVDDTGDGTGIVYELNEENNTDETVVHLLENPENPQLQNLEKCNSPTPVYFNLYEAVLEINPEYDLSFHILEADAQNNRNPIENPEQFEISENPQTIYLRISNQECFITESVTLTVTDCTLPDASIDFPEVSACRNRKLNLPFTVYNLESTSPLPAGVSVAFFAENELLRVIQTPNPIPIDGSETLETELELPESLPDPFELTAIVNDDGYGNSSVEELRTDNNSFSRSIYFESIPPLPRLPDLTACNEGFGRAVFDLTVQNSLLPDGEIRYFLTKEDALQKQNPVENPESYHSRMNPQPVFVRFEDTICFAITSFELKTENCKPFIPQAFSPNNDGINDEFEISNLLNIYEDFELRIYSRHGDLIHIGYNKDGFWDGIATRGLLFTGKKVPQGTYYYVLILNDVKYPKPFIGWVYVNY